MAIPAPAHAVRARQRASDTPDPFFATTLARGLTVLAAFRPGDVDVGSAELAQRTGLTRPTVSRLINTLLQLGYVRRGRDGRYRLSTHVLRLAYPVLAQLRIRQLAHPLMREFAEQVRGTVSIGTFDDVELVYIETVRTTDAADFVPDIGLHLSLVQSAMGRALMSMLSDTEALALLDRVRIASPALWDRYQDVAQHSIEQCRKLGFSVSIDGLREEVHAVGAPIMTSPEGERLAINCGIPVYRLRPGQLEQEIGPRLAALAASIRGLALRERIAT
jgi:DNA-binding IclR family transcriptional regulator